MSHRREFWDARYAQEDWAYGTEPNRFLRAVLTELRPTGSALFPAEGEGRNAVFAAQSGLSVTAVDVSGEGRQKALRLARQRGVRIHYRVADFGDLEFPPAAFDLIALIFAHFPQDRRREYHRRLAQLLAPGGALVLEGFSRDHRGHQRTNPTAGGPPDPALLFDEETIRTDFGSLLVDRLSTEVVELDEGRYHRGAASVVRLVARCPDRPDTRTHPTPGRIR